MRMRKVKGKVGEVEIGREEGKRGKERREKNDSSESVKTDQKFFIQVEKHDDKDILSWPSFIPFFYFERPSLSNVNVPGKSVCSLREHGLTD